MAAQKGKDLLLKVDSDGLGSFMTVAGLRSRAIAFNAETVDITHQESAGQWRELLVGGPDHHRGSSGRLVVGADVDRHPRLPCEASGGDHIITNNP